MTKLKCACCFLFLGFLAGDLWCPIHRYSNRLTAAQNASAEVVPDEPWFTKDLLPGVYKVHYLKETPENVAGKEFLSPVFHAKAAELDDDFRDKLLLYRNLKPTHSPPFLGDFGCLLLSGRGVGPTEEVGRGLYLVDYSVTNCTFTVYSAGSLTLDSGNEVFYAVETLGDWTNPTATKAFIQFLKTADPDAYRQAGDLIRISKKLCPEHFVSMQELEFMEELDLADFLRE